MKKSVNYLAWRFENKTNIVVSIGDEPINKTIVELTTDSDTYSVEKLGGVSTLLKKMKGAAKSIKLQTAKFSGIIDYDRIPEIYTP